MYIQCPSYDIKIIMSDFNAKVGNESWLKQSWEATAYMIKATVMENDS
jgi:hypothetical protein